MRYKALACDYDGTLAEHNQLEPEQISLLVKLQASGRKLILVTGRVLDDLLQIIPDLSIFNYVVCENGALLYEPSTKKEKLLGEEPSQEFLELAAERNVCPIYRGRSIVATLTPCESILIEIIKELGLEWQIIFNKTAVMALPPGVNKASGLKAALKELGLSPHNCIGVGDAENDHAFLNLCEVGVAVSNAIEPLKGHADLITKGAVFEGVSELIGKILDDDLNELQGKLKRASLKIGADANDMEVQIEPYGTSMLVAGASGSGKSTVAHSVLERLTEKRYQFCLIDPEGDYEKLENVVSLGGAQNVPLVSEIMQVLNNANDNVVVNLLGVPLADRPKFFHSLLPHLHEFYMQTGRPHWLVIDEAHHLLPSDISQSSLALSELAGSLLMVTVHPEHVNTKALSTVDTLLSVGRFPQQTIRKFCSALAVNAPAAVIEESTNGNVVAWMRRSQRDPFLLHITHAKQERQRHRRKYATGDVGREKSFVFRGPDFRLKLRAQNLQIFLQMAEGVDEDTWLYHLRRCDYSRWFQDAIKDEELATLMAAIEAESELSAAESLEQMKELVSKRYGAPE